MKNQRAGIPIFLLLIVALWNSPMNAVTQIGENNLRIENHSFAHIDEVVVNHIELDLTVDFKKKQLSGKAILFITNKIGANQLFLDSRDLTISKVTMGKKGTSTSYRFGEEVPSLGRPLIIDILPETKIVAIHYSTSPDAAALQWLDPAQTAGGVKPFLFTQSQAILARSWVPCQDNPGIRITYRAIIKTPPGMLALMSAQNAPTKDPKGRYEFYMPQPIPTYLLALVVGDIDFSVISDRCGVYAEPSLVDTAAWEFAETEKMIAAAEKLYDPYRWGRYDMIVLPPCFPFGGMENPRLTFVTPTLLAGDRSLVSVIAHELAHSWSGNLVTNATWNDFWINEGFTTYFERRIDEEMFGKDFAEMEALLGFQDLKVTLNQMGYDSVDTRLHLDLQGRDPDDAVSDIAYEKGYLFLRKIEETVGREVWDRFLRKYFDTFAFQNMTTSRFVAYLREHLIKGNQDLEDELRIDVWMDSTGLHANAPIIRSDAFTKVDGQLKLWQEGTSAANLNTEGWVGHQWQYFVRNLPLDISTRQLVELDNEFHFTRSGNAEILDQWLVIAIRRGYAPADDRLEQFLLTVGRRKLLKPLYTEFAKTPDGLEKARNIYQNARPRYHSVTVNTIDEILGWKK